MSLQPPLFPIDQPVMPEDRQIGRVASIEMLSARIGDATHQWLIGPRRIGKTSVAKAALARLRAGSAVALDVDMSKLAITDEQGLAGELARQAQAAHAGVSSAGGRVKRLVRRHAADLGKAVTSLGYRDEGEALAAVSALLAGADDGAPGLGAVLDALALHAHATGIRSAVLLDEVHLLGGVDGCEREVARLARDADVPLVFVFAGSEESAVRALRETGRPLASIGAELALPDISSEDWMSGLGQRFAEGEITIGGSELYAIIDAADGHPRRTMLICARVQSSALAAPNHEATPAVVELAIRDARGDRSWT
jgi:hypothetical protein